MFLIGCNYLIGKGSRYLVRGACV